MKYQANIGGSSFEVEVIPREDGQLVVRIGDEERLVRVDAQSPETFSIVRGPSATDAHVRHLSATEERVYLDNHSFVVELLDERQLRSRQATQAGGESGHQTIASPMPGKVVNLLRRQGDSVKAGDGVIIVEAMKMENELKAAVDGVIVELLVQPGDTVDGGAPLVRIAPPEASA